MQDPTEPPAKKHNFTVCTYHFHLPYFNPVSFAASTVASGAEREVLRPSPFTARLSKVRPWKLIGVVTLQADRERSEGR